MSGTAKPNSKKWLKQLEPVILIDLVGVSWACVSGWIEEIAGEALAHLTLVRQTEQADKKSETFLPHVQLSKEETQTRWRRRTMMVVRLNASSAQVAGSGIISK